MNHLYALILLSLFMPLVGESSEISKFIERYCYDCHDEDVQKGGIRLDNLSKDLADSSVMSKWVKVHDQIKSGEMPPKKKKKQPSAAERQSFLKTVSPVLYDADLKNKEVVLRRLNREEIQNTVNDQFHIKLDLKHLLPEDSITQGFDNIGSGMSISTELMQSYLEFADRVVEQAIVPERKPQIINKTYNFKDIERIQKNKKRIRVVEDGIVLYHQNDLSSSTLYEFRASFRGNYRIKINYGAWENKEKLNLKMRVYAGNLTVRGQMHNYGFYDVPNGKTSITIEPYLRAGETLRVVAYNTGIGHLKNASTETRAGVWIGDIHAEGPLLESWPVKSKASIFNGVDPQKAGMEDARNIISNFLPKAFRRQVEAGEVEGYLKLFKEIFEKSKSFEEGIKVVLKAVICSADFIFMVEKGNGELSDYELASRLSYYLWSSCPDEVLFTLAENGQLKNPQVLKDQTERMLSSPKAERLVKNFTGQWLKLRQVDDTVPDKKLYPEYDEYLRYSLLKETELFFKEILRNNLSIVNFINSEFIMINDRMARHYGIAGVKGSHFRKYTVPEDSPRGGIMTQASIMKVTANGTDTSPILRGVWILENIMGVHVPPPPPAVPAVEPDIRGTVTIREQLEAHKSNKSCFGCHSKIDPVGFAFENMDPVGTFRTYYRTIGGKGKHVKKDEEGRKVNYRVGPNVDATGKLKNGTEFNGVKEFKEILAKSPQNVVDCLTEKMMTYALGRITGFSDRPEMDAISHRLKDKNYGFKTLIHQIIQSKIFKSH
ncbi:MAG: DUF1592 domain-containing protein [Lentisphaeraceae bacterium]|nr:DUF1592 domain-containing protein [Lentisphaeraceae bacterium]